MSDVARVTLGFLGFIIASIAFFSLVFPEQVAERISSIKKISITPKGANLELAEKLFQDAARDRGEKQIESSKVKELIGPLISSSRILWVDDDPNSNSREISALRELGHIVDEVTSNNNAMRYFSLRSYNVIISDINRKKPESGTSGLELPALLKAVKGSVPPIIYYVHVVDEPLTKDGYPVVNYPTDLFKLLNLVIN